jgi:hypothetical protein
VLPPTKQQEFLAIAERESYADQFGDSPIIAKTLRA